MYAKTGNLKIGKDTLIINMGSATHCPSGLSGQCNLFGKRDCYAFKAEIQYKDTLPYREKQAVYWKSNDAFTFVEEINKIVSKKLKTAIKYVRWNESGDIASGECIQKLIDIAEMTPELIHYTYTHNKVELLKFLGDRKAKSVFPKNLIINCSDFHVEGLNTFKVDFDYKVNSLKKEWKEYRNHAKATHGNNKTCIGDCSKCTLCKVSHGKEILVPLH